MNKSTVVYIPEQLSDNEHVIMRLTELPNGRTDVAPTGYRYECPRQADRAALRLSLDTRTAMRR